MHMQTSGRHPAKEFLHGFRMLANKMSRFRDYHFGCVQRRVQRGKRDFSPLAPLVIGIQKRNERACVHQIINCQVLHEWRGRQYPNGSPLFSMAWKASFHAEGMSLEPQRGSALQPKVARVRKGYLGFPKTKPSTPTGLWPLPLPHHTRPQPRWGWGLLSCFIPE